MTFKKIFVPVDFSKTSDQAVDYALFLAEIYNASVTLFHSVVLMQEDIDEEEHLKSYESIIKRQEEKRLKSIKSRSLKGEKRGIRIKHELGRGLNAGDSILDYLKEKKFDLIVMGTHSRIGLMKWWLGSVTQKVIRYSHIPLIVVPQNFKRKTIKKVLFPVDFSEFSKNAVKKGKTIVQKFDAKMTILFAIEEEAHPFYYLQSSEPILKANPQLKQQLMNNLPAFTGIAKNVAKYHLAEGKAHKEIQDYAESNKIDLIIMATHGMSGMDHFLIGSTTERVASNAPCPVMTIRV